MKFKKYIIPIIGGVAFVAGGYFTRAKTLDAIETIEDRMHKDKHVTSSDEK